MAEWKFKPFTPANLNRSGIIAVMKGAGVRGWVEKTVSGMAETANAQARARRTPQELHYLEDYSGAPYEGVVKAGRADTLGVVRARSSEGQRDQSEHHTLDSLNH